MQTATPRLNTLIRVGLGTLSLLIPAGAYLVTRERPLGIATFLMLLLLVGPATIYMVAVRSLRGTVYFGSAILLLYCFLGLL
jgi:uncharacterized membrane protein